MLIDLEKATVGMKITDDVLLPQGGVLVKAPIVVSESLLETLRKHSIKQVEVQPSDEPNDIDPSADAAQSEPLPRIQVIVAEDRMSASLRLEPGGDGVGPLTVEHLYTALSVTGVSNGINPNLLRETIEKWKRVKRLYDIKDVALGEAPVPGRQGAFKMETKHIASAGQLESARTTPLCRRLVDLEIPIERVVPGTVIARRLNDLPPKAGRDVYGDEVSTTEMIKDGSSLDKSVKLAANGRDIVAGIEGLAYCVDKTIGVVPVSFDGSVELSVSPDQMRATFLCYPAMDGGRHPKEEELRRLLAEKRITHGIKEDVLDELRKSMARGIYPPEPVVIAEGMEAVNGEDGRVEFFFNTETTLTPKENSDGTVDYKNVDLVQSVSAGTALAKLLPPTDGVPGIDIFGATRPCRSGVPAQLPSGVNTQVDSSDETVLIAATDGMIHYNGKTVEISEGYVIDGDVDFSTGNVKYQKSVTIAGDVKSGFAVDCGGDLQVGGTIEDALLTCGGNVLCKLGFVGTGRGSIEAKGNVNIGFIKNQSVRAQGNVTIAREAMNSTILSRNAITVNGSPLSVAGGNLVARNSILVYTVGNSTGIRTHLEVGVDFVLNEEYEATERKIAELEETHKKLLAGAQKYARFRQIRKKLSAPEEALAAKVHNTLIKCEQQMKALDKRKQLIEGKMHDLDQAYIKVDHAAMPGTTIKMGERHLLIREEIVGPKTIRLIKHDIRII